MAVPSRKLSGSVIRSVSPKPSGRFYSSNSRSTSLTSSAFASSTSSLTSRSATFFHRASSPTRVNLSSSNHSSPSVRFSLDRPGSPNRSITVSARNCGSSNNNKLVKKQSNSKRTCLCSPTTHPGSFRCSLHKGLGFSPHSPKPHSQNRLNAWRSAMTNSLVRIGGVEGELVKRALAALIRPSSHNLRRRSDFQPRPSRLSAMSKAEDS